MLKIALGILNAERLIVPEVNVTKPVNVVVPVFSLSVKLPGVVIPVVVATDTVPVVLNVKGPVTVSAAGNIRLFDPLMVVPPAPVKVIAPAPVILTPPVKSVKTTEVITVAFALMVAAGTLKVPAVWVIPPLKIALPILNAERSIVPEVSVTKPVKVVVPVFSLSVKLPGVVIPVVVATDTVPVVLNVTGPVTVNAAGKIRLFVPAMVVPPAPVKVILPVPVILAPPVKFVATVDVITLFPVVPKVAVGTLNVPAVWVIPPLKIALPILNAERSIVPEVSVTKPVNVVVVVLSLSVILPGVVTPVVVATDTVPVVLKVKGPVTVRAAGKIKLFDPAMVVPPAPVKVILPAPLMAAPLLRLIATVDVIVVPLA